MVSSFRKSQNCHISETKPFVQRSPLSSNLLLDSLWRDKEKTTFFCNSNRKYEILEYLTLISCFLNSRLVNIFQLSSLLLIDVPRYCIYLHSSLFKALLSAWHIPRIPIILCFPFHPFIWGNSLCCITVERGLCS